MEIDNGSQQRLEIHGVFEGVAGVAGGFLTFVPNRADRSPATARAGVLNGVPVTIAPIKDPAGPFWTSRYEVLG